jgi:hypothetical protein
MCVHVCLVHCRLQREGAATKIQHFWRGSVQFKKMMAWARKSYLRKIVLIQQHWRVRLKKVLLDRCDLFRVTAVGA